MHQAPEVNSVNMYRIDPKYYNEIGSARVKSYRKPWFDWYSIFCIMAVSTRAIVKYKNWSNVGIDLCKVLNIYLYQMLVNKNVLPLYNSETLNGSLVCTVFFWKLLYFLLVYHKRLWISISTNHQNKVGCVPLLKNKPFP